MRTTLLVGGLAVAVLAPSKGALPSDAAVRAILAERVEALSSELDPRVLDAYAGRYGAAGEGVFTISRSANYLVILAPDSWGLPPLRIGPESATDFFASELPLRVKFQTDERRRATGILVYPPRGQAAVPARKIGSA